MDMQSIFQIRRRHRKPNRRGVLLLVCLSLLVLFAVIGVTFVMVSGQYRRAARSEVRTERYGDDPSSNTRPGELLDEAFMQLARGTTNNHSSLQFHDLLGDMYGHGSLQGEIAQSSTIDATNFLAGGQFIQLPAINATGLAAEAKVNGFFNGQLITFLDGPLRGVTARIVGYQYTNTPSELGYVRVMAFEGWTQAALTTAWNTFIANAPARFVINDRAFIGTGFGYDPADTTPNDGLLSLPDADGHPLALAPHFKYSAHGGVDPVQGGANEDYDAADPQNLALAYLAPGGTSSGQIMPSFHRPDLVNYWVNAESLSSIYDDGDLARHIILRPLHTDHPNFTGSNASVINPATPFNPVIGPWDIDNDGDGVPDSVWIDLGFPAQTSADGRQFKPLFAFLCLDLDGRLNVNAHGSLAQADVPTYSQALSGYFAGGTNSLTLPRGLGYGPADINLQYLFNPGDSNDLPFVYQRLLAGHAGTNIVGRYGNDGAPGSVGVEDPLSYFKQLRLPNPIYSNRLSSWATPPDVRGRGAVAIDVRGTPLFMNMSLAGETLDDPYEVDLSRRHVRNLNGADALFTANELEALLRPYDIDHSGLPPRLQNALRADQAAPGRNDLQHLVTTDSHDPSAFVARPTREKATTGFNGNILDWINRQAGVALTADQIVRLVPPEVMFGAKMDINRPLGNGRDDQWNAVAGTPGKGIVDEPGEMEGTSTTEPEKMFPDAVDTGLAAANATSISTQHGDVPSDIVNSGTTPADATATYLNGILARQALARHLYVLMMLVKGNGEIDFDGDTTNNSAAETATGLAQWSVNVVDFIDRDSIMTPFEFDLEPFVDNDSDPANGTWDVDGDPATNDGAWRGQVWGCERPKLLISETLAFHDRRTEDLDDPNRKTTFDSDPGTPPNPEGETDQPPAGVNDFDQRLRPSGSFFVELYNPWRTAYSSVISTVDRPAAAESSGEFYEFYATDETQAEVEGVYLNRTASDGTPVWRLSVVLTADREKQPDHPIPADRLAEGDIERFVYFAQPPGAAANNKFYPSNAPAPVRPGRYAVVGSAGIKGDGITPIGRQSAADPTNYDLIRRIQLSMDADPEVNQVQVLNNQSTPVEPAIADIKPIVAVMVDEPRSLNISEPIDGYNPMDANGVAFDPTQANGEGLYIDPWDQPLDDLHADNEADYLALKTIGTTAQFRVVHLQRLANPLLPWNADTNPYLTIDSMAVNLTVFNGVEDESPAYLTQADTEFASRQRGDNPTNNVVRNLWSHEQDDDNVNASAAAVGNPHVFNYDLQHTLGYLNKNYGAAYTSAAGTVVPPGNDNRYRGEPSQGPFPWFVWKNSPVISPYELMLVPKSRPSRLLQEYAIDTVANPYAASTPSHLINFFDKANTGGDLYRVFDFLRVPSPYIGAETFLNPTTFKSTASGPANAGSDGFHPPFNYVLEMRDPGKININTIASQVVWQGLMNGRTNTTWQQIVDSRRGYGTNVNPILVDPAQPTIFSNPFRSANSAMLTLPNTQTRADIDVTLMRPSPSSATRPLFGPDVSSPQPYSDPNRNPYFRYEELNRISNLVTTRSNVYAVWVTVGYFEVEPVAVSTVHPDGFALGQELGADTGEITRHRGFYIFDRTLPVGYLPGQNLNVEKAILLKRFIE